ncbi:MAG: hypothetical protein IJU44_11225 [Kiritimatiellae bacterium]|nr:hypothetical protein [Kiritimatiellia bacterium]
MADPVTVDIAPALRALGALESAAGSAAGSAALAEAVAESCAELTREWLERLSSERHRPGNPHDFYLSAADSVLAASSPGRAERPFFS